MVKKKFKNLKDIIPIVAVVAIAGLLIVLGMQLVPPAPLVIQPAPDPAITPRIGDATLRLANPNGTAITDTTVMAHLVAGFTDYVGAADHLHRHGTFTGRYSGFGDIARSGTPNAAGEIVFRAIMPGTYQVFIRDTSPLAVGEHIWYFGTATWTPDAADARLGQPVAGEGTFVTLDRIANLTFFGTGIRAGTIVTGMNLGTVAGSNLDRGVPVELMATGNDQRALATAIYVEVASNVVTSAGNTSVVTLDWIEVGGVRHTTFTRVTDLPATDPLRINAPPATHVGGIQHLVTVIPDIHRMTDTIRGEVLIRAQCDITVAQVAGGASESQLIIRYVSFANSEHTDVGGSMHTFVTRFITGGTSAWV